MMSHFTQTWFHLIFFALWFGGHVTVLLLLWQMHHARGALNEQARLSRAMLVIERVPRTAFVLMLPMGLQLSENLGLFQLGGLGALGAWIIALVWLVGIWMQPRSKRTDIAVGLRVAQRVLMVSVGLIMLGAALLSVLAGEPIAFVWLAGKFALYGIALLLVFGIELATQPILYASAGPGLRPTKPIDQAIDEALPRVTVLAIALFACLAGASYLGLVQPI